MATKPRGVKLIPFVETLRKAQEEDPKTLVEAEVKAGPTTKDQILEKVPAQEPSSPNSSSTLTLSTAGNLSRYFSKWEQITSDKFVIPIIKNGYKFQFLKRPKLFDHKTHTLSPEKFYLIKSEIGKLQNCGAISKVHPFPDHYVSRVFIRKKANGQDRMIIDLKTLNKYIVKVHFRMEDRQFLKKMISENDYLVSIDLNGIGFSVPIHPSCFKFATFEFKNQRFHYNVLPFGLSSVPRALLHSIG